MSLWGNDDRKDEAAGAMPDVTMPVDNSAVPAVPSMPPASDAPSPMPSADAVEPGVPATVVPQAGGDMGATAPPAPNPEEVSMADEVPAVQPPVEPSAPVSPVMPAAPAAPSAPAEPGTGEEPKV